MTATHGTTSAERRIPTADHHAIVGVPVREDDIEPTTSLHWVAHLFRIMAGVLLALMVLQVFFGATSTVPISVGVLAADAVRLIIFAGLLIAAGGLADLWIESHHDIRATRILVARMSHTLQELRAEPNERR